MVLGEAALLLVKGFVFFMIIVLSALPLYLAVKFLGGKATILKVILVNILAGIAVPAVKFFVGLYLVGKGIYGGIVAFLFLLFIYKIFFRLGWIRAFLAWILQFVVIVILIFITALLGFSVIAL